MTGGSPFHFMRRHGGGAAGLSGASFPVTPVASDVFFRTDRGEEYFYDGTRWLTTQLYTADNILQNASVDTTTYLVTPELAVSDIWLVDIQTITFRAGAGEWDYILQKRTPADVPTDIYTRDGNGAAANVWLPQKDTLGVLVASATHPFLTTFADEVSGTVNFFCQCALRYRVVG